MKYRLMTVGLIIALATANGDELGTAGLRHISERIRGITFETFHAAIKANEFSMPTVRSSWATNMPTDYSASRRLGAARDFGGALFSRVDQWASEMTTVEPSPKAVAQFLDVADWVMKSPGYGNFFIAKRCHDIAAWEIARALADTNCALDGITNQFARFGASWKTPSGRADVLNVDAGARLFEVRPDPAEVQQQELDSVWNIGRIMVSKYSSPEMQAVFEGHRPKGMEAASELVHRWSAGMREQPFTREYISFFKDDGKVSAKNWNANDHEALIMPYVEPQLPRLKSLAEFRAAIGYFPGKYVPNEESATSKQKAAFIQVWTDYRRQKGLSENTGVAVTAWEVYRDILSGAFPR